MQNVNTRHVNAIKMIHWKPKMKNCNDFTFVYVSMSLFHFCCSFTLHTFLHFFVSKHETDWFYRKSVMPFRMLGIQTYTKCIHQTCVPVWTKNKHNHQNKGAHVRNAFSWVNNGLVGWIPIYLNKILIITKNIISTI